MTRSQFTLHLITHYLAAKAASQGEKYYEDGQVVNDNGELHAEWYK